MEPWTDILNIPERRVGNDKTFAAVEHFTKPAGEEIPRASMRTRIFGGHDYSPLVFDRETKWHRLVYEGGVWMTDLPIEQQQHDDTLKDFDGDVLIGGLGLGYAATVLCQREEIYDVTVVEKDERIIQLVERHVRAALGDDADKLTVIHADLMQYVKTMPAYDWAFYDIWQSDGESTFHNVVVPLLEASEAAGIADSQVFCWNEDVMRGQLCNALQSRRLMVETQLGVGPKGEALTYERLAKPGRDVYWDWSAPFFEHCRRGLLNDEDTFRRAASVYAWQYGRGYRPDDLADFACRFALSTA